MNTKEINTSFINTVKSTELEGLTTDFSEIALEQLFDANGIVKDVPIIGSIVKIIKI